MRKLLAVTLLAAVAVLLAQNLACGPEAATQPVTKAPAAKAVAPAPTPKSTPTPATKAATVAPAPTPAPAKDGWKQSYKADFSGGKLSDKWEVIAGAAKLDKGALVLKADDDSSGAIVLKEPAFTAPSVRVEFTGAFAKAEQVCDMSTFLNTTKDGYPNGYMFQFAAGGNEQNRIRKDEEIIDLTINKKLLPVKAETKYTVVVENDKGRLKMTVNGQTIFDYKDAKPISGPKNGMVGFYTWQSELRIDSLAVYEKQ